MKRIAKLKVIGAGPTGCLTAIALAHNKYDVTLTDLLSEEQLLKRDRVYAITHSSRRFFEKNHIWNDLNSIMKPFKRLIIEDSFLNNKITLDRNDLKKCNYSSKDLGWIIDHKDLMGYLFEKIKRNQNIKLLLQSDLNDNFNSFDYYLAADGVSSSSRKKWNIKRMRIPYNQSCITFKALLRSINTNVAYEILRPDGPMAILPINSDLYQIVLTAPSNKCHKLLSLSSADFLDKIAITLPPSIEIDCLYNQPQCFPQELSIAYSLNRGNNFLIGESAHSIHPIGGQGLNLSIRDIGAIIELLNNSREPNSFRLKEYTIFILSRYIDILMISFITDSLIRIFSNKSLLLIPFRRFAFTILNKSSFFRIIILSLMTDGAIFK
ncbi:FAD-dependent monooxygenase [Prochlorococcus marinus]|uniref:FAD-dependent monooxygenase n=1 Tax=Prochlorococcus marinus TaxID=1219 RepID=UPI0022B33AD2|nr:FAD-dependent monooxygenase [Prochlorococcus marinus]